MKKYLIITISTVILVFTLVIIYSIFFINQKNAVLNNDFNIVLITIDALRPDHLSCYGYERRTTPNIDKIAEKGIIFKNAIAPSSWTAPSIASLFTSLYPINHGVIHGFREGDKIFNREVYSKKIKTLAETLKKQGYTTFGIAANLQLSANLGFARGFDYFSCPGFKESGVVNKIAFSWKDKIKSSSKYFLWIHYIDPHWFYFAREPWIKEYNPSSNSIPEWTSRLPLEIVQKALEIKQGTTTFNTLVALYDSEINYADHHLKILIDQLQLLKNSILIITSDHGEDFLEHGTFGHSKTLYAESINIPLIIRLPWKKSKKVIEQQVSLLDIMPTIFSLLKIPYHEKVFGESLITLNGEEKNIAERLLFAELGRDHNDMRAVVTRDWKYICDYKSNTEELYNIIQDPKESINLIKVNSSLGKKLKDQLTQWITFAPRYPAEIIKITLSPKVENKLESLGYIESD